MTCPRRRFLPSCPSLMSSDASSSTPLSSLLDPYFRYPPYTPHKARMLAAVLSFQPPTWARILARLAKPLLYALLLALSYRLGRRSRPAIGMR